MAPQEVSEIAGPQLLVIFLNSGLLGVLSVQIYLYYLAFPNDRWFMKCLVYGIYILEFAQSVLILDVGFQRFVTGFGDVELFSRIETDWLSVPTFTAIDTFFVQGFYAYRLRSLAQSNKVAGVITALSFIQLAGGIAVGVHAERTGLFTPLKTHTLAFEVTTTAMWIVGSILCDVIIAVCMTYYLSRYDTTFKQTKIILKKTIRLTIETGTLTAVVGIVCFSLVILRGNSFEYQVPMGIIGKVYANSMLVLINSRMLLEEMPSKNISVIRFDAAGTNSKDGSIESHHRDLSVDPGTQAGLSRSSEPEAV